MLWYVKDWTLVALICAHLIKSRGPGVLHTILECECREELYENTALDWISTFVPARPTSTSEDQQRLDCQYREKKPRHVSYPMYLSPGKFSDFGFRACEEQSSHRLECIDESEYVSVLAKWLPYSDVAADMSCFILVDWPCRIYHHPVHPCSRSEESQTMDTRNGS